jgi:hypothetical protein
LPQTLASVLLWWANRDTAICMWLSIAAAVLGGFMGGAVWAFAGWALSRRERREVDELLGGLGREERLERAGLAWRRVATYELYDDGRGVVDCGDWRSCQCPRCVATRRSVVS